MLRYHAVSGVDPSRRLMPSIATWCHFLRDVMFSEHVASSMYPSVCQCHVPLHELPTISNRVSWPLYYYVFAMFSHGVSILSHTVTAHVAGEQWVTSGAKTLFKTAGGHRADANGRRCWNCWNTLKYVEGIEGVEQRTFWNLRDLKLYWLVPMSWKLLNPFLTASSFGLWKDVLLNSWWKQWKLWVCTAWVFRAHRWERWKSARMQQRFCRSPETSRTRASYFQLWFGKIWRRMHDARNRLMRSSHTSLLPSP